MALVPCVECGQIISDQAKTCPHCGIALIVEHPMPPPLPPPLPPFQRPKPKQGNYVSTITVIAVILILIWTFGSLYTPQSVLTVPTPVITLAEYNQISPGMTYKSVCSIIGANGTEDSRNFMQGVPGVMESIETVMYSWVNANGGNMNAIFQNDKLVQKAQFGLE